MGVAVRPYAIAAAVRIAVDTPTMILCAHAERTTAMMLISWPSATVGAAGRWLKFTDHLGNASWKWKVYRHGRRRRARARYRLRRSADPRIALRPARRATGWHARRRTQPLLSRNVPLRFDPHLLDLEAQLFVLAYLDLE